MLDAYGALQQVTGKLKNYYNEVTISSNSNMTNLSCRIVYNTNKVYRVWAELGSLAANNTTPLDLTIGRVALIRSPSTPALTAGGTLFKAKFSTPSSYTITSSDIRFECINPSSSPYLSMQQYLIGDVNGDGSVTSSDSLLVLQQSTGSVSLTAAQKIRADVNFDGKINATDSQQISQYSASVIRTVW